MSIALKKPSFDEIYMELAEKLALRSHCVKAQVGAVLTKDTRIVSLGYNGPPAGTHNCDQEWPGAHMQGFGERHSDRREQHRHGRIRQ